MSVLTNLTYLVLLLLVFLQIILSFWVYITTKNPKLVWTIWFLHFRAILVWALRFVNFKPNVDSECSEKELLKGLTRGQIDLFNYKNKYIVFLKFAFLIIFFNYLVMIYKG